MFNKGFINDYLPALILAVKKKLLNASEASVRNVKKDRIDGIIQCLVASLGSRLMTYKQRDYEKNA